MPTGVRSREAERVSLRQRVPHVRAAVGTRADVDPCVVEAARIHVVEAALHGVGREQPVATLQPSVVRRQVVAVPALRANSPRLVPAAPPDLVAALTVARRAVEVTNGQVLAPDVRRLLHFDPVADSVPPVDDHLVPVQPAQVQIRRADHDPFRIDARSDQYPVTRLRRVDRALDRRVVLVLHVRVRDDERRARMRRCEGGEHRGQEGDHAASLFPRRFV